MFMFYVAKDLVVQWYQTLSFIREVVGSSLSGDHTDSMNRYCIVIELVVLKKNDRLSSPTMS